MARDIYISRTTLVISLVIILCVVSLAFMTIEERYVAAPAFACIIMVIWLWMILWDRDKKIPFFDVGFICALATLIYSVFPLLNYWADGLNFGLLGDFRLQTFNITPADLGFFHLRHVLYIFSFVVFYVAFRGRGIIETGNVNSPDPSTKQIIILFFLLLTGYFLILRIMTGINYNTSYEPEAYARNRSAFANAPLILLQISGKLGGILFLFKLALLYLVVSRCTHRSWRIILLIWVTAEIINALVLKGGRSGLLLFLLATLLFYHRLIKQLTMKFLITSGTMLFVFFIFLGVYRQYINIDFLKFDLSEENVDFLTSTNEFQALLGTAYDVHLLKESGATIPWYLYINDIVNVLPPQQLLPFEKIPAWDWYLREIGLSGTGLGLMWGVISQSIVGLDWIELFLRGALLGYILARFHRWYLKHQAGFFGTLIYVFLCLKVYYTFRDTTFSLLTDFIWEILPFYLLLRLTVGHSLFQITPSTKENLTFAANSKR